MDGQQCRIFFPVLALILHILHPSLSTITVQWFRQAWKWDALQAFWRVKEEVAYFTTCEWYELWSKVVNLNIFWSHVFASLRHATSQCAGPTKPFPLIEWPAFWSQKCFEICSKGCKLCYHLNLSPNSLSYYPPPGADRQGPPFNAWQMIPTHPDVGILFHPGDRDTCWLRYWKYSGWKAGKALSYLDDRRARAWTVRFLVQKWSKK